jgi:hypothetical protein
LISRRSARRCFNAHPVRDIATWIHEDLLTTVEAVDQLELAAVVALR